MANTSSVDLILEAAEIIDQDNGIRLNSEKVSTSISLSQCADKQKEVLLNGMSGREHDAERKRDEQDKERVMSEAPELPNYKHNENERKRRKLLKHSQYSLRAQLRRKTRRPALNSVLKAAYDEIQELKEIETEQVKVLDELKQKNIILSYFLEKSLKDIKLKQQNDLTKGSGRDESKASPSLSTPRSLDLNGINTPYPNVLSNQPPAWPVFSPAAPQVISPHLIQSPVLYTHPQSSPTMFTYQPHTVPLISYSNGGFHTSTRTCFSLPYLYTASPSVTSLAPHPASFLYGRPILMQTAAPSMVAPMMEGTKETQGDLSSSDSSKIINGYSTNIQYKAGRPLTTLEECEVKISREFNPHVMTASPNGSEDSQVPENSNHYNVNEIFCKETKSVPPPLVIGPIKYNTFYSSDNAYTHSTVREI